MKKSMHRRNDSVKAFAALAFGLGLSWPVDATACDEPPYRASDSDRHFIEAAAKDSLYDGPSGFDDWQDYYVDRFGFRGNEGWGLYEDEGWNYGWNDDDNPELPLGRTLGAIFLLHHSDETDTADWNTREGHMLKWMYGYTAGAYNELDDLRAGACHEWKSADMDSGIFVDDRIMLYQSFFANNVVVRAGFLMHEAIHYKGGISHTAGSKADANYYYDAYIQVPSGRIVVSKLNPNPSKYSVYGAQARWSLEYFAYAVRHTNNTRRNAALRKFKDIITHQIKNHDTLPDYVADALAWAYLPT
jgi:hypothetical protein